MAELMTSYYDRLYYKTRDWQEDFTLSLEDFNAAGEELERQLRERLRL